MLSVQWCGHGLWMAARLQVIFFLYRPHCFNLHKSCCFYANFRWHLNKKSKEVCFKARSHPASLVFIVQVTRHTTVKWSSLSKFFCFMLADVFSVLPRSLFAGYYCLWFSNKIFCMYSSIWYVLHGVKLAANLLNMFFSFY